jgi:hypothetical protein
VVFFVFSFFDVDDESDDDEEEEEEEEDANIICSPPPLTTPTTLMNGFGTRLYESESIAFFLAAFFPSL